MDRRARAFPRRGVLREIFVRAQSHPAGAAGCHWIHHRREPSHRRSACETERKRRHCADAVRDWNSCALCGDVCVSILLPLRVLRSHSNLFADDADHGRRVPARRPVECDRGRCARHRGWFSNAGVAFDRSGSPARTFRLHRAARYRSARAFATTRLECASDSRRRGNCTDAIRLGRDVLYSRKIFRWKQSAGCHGGICRISGAVSRSSGVVKAYAKNEP